MTTKKGKLKPVMSWEVEQIIKLEEENKKLREALVELVGCPYIVDSATVPKGGIDVAPEQVVVNMSVGWTRLLNAKAALSAAKGAE